MVLVRGLCKKLVSKLKQSRCYIYVECLWTMTCGDFLCIMLLKKSFDKWLCAVAKGIKEAMCLYLIFKGCFKQFTMINLGVRLYSQKLWALGLTSYAIKSTLIKLLCTDEKLCFAHCHGLRRQNFTTLVTTLFCLLFSPKTQSHTTMIVNLLRLSLFQVVYTRYFLTTSQLAHNKI